MKIRAEMGRRHAPLWPHEYQVDKVVVVPNVAFASFMIQPLDCYDFIERNKVEPHQGTGLNHCLLVLSDDRTDGALVQCGDDGRAMYTAYVAGARDIVQVRLERVANFIVGQGTQRTASGSWYVYYDELERELGLTIRDGSGLDAMLLDTMCARPEVADVALINGCVDAVYHLSYCKNLEAQEDIPAEFSPERAAELLDNAISAALGLYQGEDSYTMLHDSFGLTLQEIREHNYMSDREIAETCDVPEELLDCCMRVRGVLELDDISGSSVLSHKDSTVLVPLDALKKLTDSGQENFTALLDTAWVADIRVDDGIPELVLEGVDAAELERLHDALEAQTRAEQAMGPAMG